MPGRPIVDAGPRVEPEESALFERCPHDRPRQAGRPTTSLDADFRSRVRDDLDSGPFERAACLWISGQHHTAARTKREHVAADRVELFVWNFHEPIATSEQKLPKWHRQER